MPKLWVVAANELVSFFEKQGFRVDRQKGSHIVLTRVVEGVSQHLVIPNHRELDRGMTHGIFKQAKEYLSEEEVRGFFYTD